MEEIIGTLLRWGVMLSAAVVAVGGVVYLARHGSEPADFGRFHGEPASFRLLGPIIHGVLAGSGRSVIQLGLVLLIATPVARVAFSVVALGFERDWKYVEITAVVLGILIYSLTGGI